MLRLIARSSNRIFGSSKQSALNSTQRYYGNENRIHNAIRIEIFIFEKYLSLQLHLQNDFTKMPVF